MVRTWIEHRLAEDRRAVQAGHGLGGSVRGHHESGVFLCPARKICEVLREMAKAPSLKGPPNWTRVVECGKIVRSFCIIALH